MARTARGFTLIEMAFTVLVLGVVAAGTIGVIAPLRDGERAALTNKRLDVAQKAIALYAIRNGCLPCPAVPDVSSIVGGSTAGRSVTAGGVVYTSATTRCLSTVACYDAVAATNTGVLPWVELGLSEEDATDGCGIRLRYVIAGDQTGTTSCGTTGTLHEPGGMLRIPGAGGCYPAGDISVTNRDPPASTTTTAAYVLFSTGADAAFGHRAITGVSSGDRWGQTSGDQFDNSHGGPAFFTGTTNDSANTSHFDDLLRYTTAPVIIQMCGAGACGNPA